MIKKKTTEKSAVPAIIGVISLLLTFVTSEIVESYFSPKVYYEKSEKVYSLNSAPGTSGNFTLGTGSVNSHLVYYYYVEDENGFKIAKSVNAEETLINNTNEKEPQIIRFYYYIDYPNWYTKINYPLEERNRQYINYKNKPILIVPENAMLQKYQIN